MQSGGEPITQQPKIYFSASISAGRQRQPLYERIVDFLSDLNANVLSAHVAHHDVLTTEVRRSAHEIFQRDMELIAACDGMIAEVSQPSLGVGYEIATCLQRGRPVLCLCERGIFLTRMLVGNRDENLRISFYQNDTEWQHAVKQFCQGL